ncbi:hypothetical protein HPC49_15470 [Pyxidicoccus fallax]|uniref:Uncharacterized protein n=1 Tax=Pyxidicoccus fallax TaxID=394095 RepID=A0A848LIE2_9BACT|nr:B-box zinc finger protein [Pyxidicoccus fallax]NMO17491.1 hypothetical protein [Pyxidicoccus fallax]NPC79618.1 hypothetical protein [Pyxidicoccus fallax]
MASRMNPAAVSSLCATHVEAPATGTCERCGTFICAAEGGRLCQPCAARGPEAYRKRVWGRRDGWAWALGLLGVWYLVPTVLYVSRGQGEVANALLGAVSGVACGLYWWGWKPMRLGIFAVPVLTGGVTLLGASQGRDVAVAFGVMLMLAVPLLLARLSTRNRLFFREEVSPAALEKSLRRYLDKRLAYVALGLSILSPCIPPLMLVSVPLWVSLLRRKDPVTGEPLLRKGTAIAGLLFALFGAWVGFVALYNFFSAPAL